MRRYWSVEFLLFVLLLAVRVAQGQVPRECANEGILLNRASCCPTPEGFNEPCGGPARGRCSSLEEVNRAENDEESSAPGLRTILSEWPNSVFSSVCTCYGLFAGYKCDECAAGYTGSKCEKRHETKERRWYQHLDDESLEQLQRAFHLAEHVSSDYLTVMPLANGSVELKQLTVLEHFVWLYHMAGAEKCFGVGYRNYGALPTWNRAFIFYLEKALAQLIGNDSFTLPYWFWFLSNEGFLSRLRNSSLTTEAELRVKRVNVCQTWADRLEPVCDMCSEQRNVTDQETNKDTVTAARNYLNQLVSELDDSDIKKMLSFILHQNIYVRESDRAGFADELNEFVFQDRGPVVALLHNFTRSDRAKAVIRHVFKFPEDLSAESPLYYLALTGLDWLFERWIKINRPSLSQVSYYAARGQNKFDPIVPFFPTQTHADFFTPSTSLGYSFEKVEHDQMMSLPLFVIVIACILLCIIGVVMVAAGLLTPTKWRPGARKRQKQELTQAPLIINIPTVAVKEAQVPSTGESSAKDETKPDPGQPVGHEKQDIPHMDESTPRSSREEQKPKGSN